MRRGLIFLALAALACALPASAHAAPDRYIVVLQDDAGDPGVVAAEHGRSHEARAEHVYRHALRGYSAVIPSHRVDEVRNDRRVAFVEADGEVTATAQTLPWGIDRIDADVTHNDVPNVNAYIIDSGIAAHSDLNVVRHVNFAGGKNTDCNGHGTHVAGTVAARNNTWDVVGVAPSAPLTGVKVLGCNGSGSYSGVIKGVDWVTANAADPAHGGKRAVANMSLGGPPSQALDDAVTRSAASGVFYALAASNDGANACNYSPARVGAGTNNGVMTVAATDSLDREASWSNFGSCVDLWAPGVSILSTRRGGGTTTMSGTSMASPHGAGGGALVLAGNATATPSFVESELKRTAASTNTFSKDINRTPIRRLYVGGF